MRGAGLYMSAVVDLFHRLFLALLLLAFVAGTAPNAMAESTAATSAATSEVHSTSQSDAMATDVGDCDVGGAAMATMGVCVASTCAPALIALPLPRLGRLPLVAHLLPGSDERRSGISGAPDPFPPKAAHLL